MFSDMERFQGSGLLHTIVISCYLSKTLRKISRVYEQQNTTLNELLLIFNREINRPQANMLKEIGSLLPENAGMRVLASVSEHAYCMSYRDTSTDTKILVRTLTVHLWNKNTHKSCSRKIIGQ
jgi:hypothetical protein